MFFCLRKITELQDFNCHVLFTMMGNNLIFLMTNSLMICYNGSYTFYADFKYVC